MVEINMDCFVRNYQPERYEKWQAGQDVGPHPEDEYVNLYKGRCRGKSIGIQQCDDPDLRINRSLQYLLALI
jgi:hypothetical protein